MSKFININASPDVFFEEIKRQIREKESPLTRHVTRLSEYAQCQSDKDYNKLVAAYDMFLFRFPNHDYSTLRFGSVTTRFHDCAALLSVGHISDVLGVESQEIPNWIFHLKTGDELMALYEPVYLTEAEDPYSYFPYQADMGIVHKSAYSSVANPNLFHAVGCLLRSQRSLNARMNTESNIEMLVKNALIIASSFKGLTRLEKAFTADGAPLLLNNIEEDEEENPDHDAIL